MTDNSNARNSFLDSYHLISIKLKQSSHLDAFVSNFFRGAALCIPNNIFTSLFLVFVRLKLVQSWNETHSTHNQLLYIYTSEIKYNICLSCNKNLLKKMPKSAKNLNFSFLFSFAIKTFFFPI